MSHFLIFFTSGLKKYSSKAIQRISTIPVMNITSRVVFPWLATKLFTEFKLGLSG